MERNHANRNIEDNIQYAVKDKSTAAQLIRLWFDFTESTAQDEAEEYIEYMKNIIKSQPLETANKLKSTFQVYFEDPGMICKFGLANVPAKHFGPAESEGYNNLFKNIYTEGIHTNSPPDEVLYQAYLLRQKLKLRFFEDYQNCKLPKAIEKIKATYITEDGIKINEGGTVVSINTRKSPRKKNKPDNLTLDISKLDRNREQAKKSLFQDDLSPSKEQELSVSDSTRTSEGERESSLFRSADADANEPFVGKGTGGTTTKFSKKPRIRQIQRNLAFARFNKAIQQNRDAVAKKLSQTRQRYQMNSLLPEDFVMEDNDEEPVTLSQFATMFQQTTERTNYEDIVLSGSTFEPSLDLWNTLNTILLEEDFAEFVAHNRYYELDMKSSSIAASIKLLFTSSIRSSTDKTTLLKKVAIKYIVRSKSNVPYLSVIGMSNKGVIGNKNFPFTFQCILACGELTENPEANQIEGVWSITPQHDNIRDNETNKKVMNVKLNVEIRNQLVETITNSFQLEPFEDNIEDEDEDVMPRDTGILINSFAIAKTKTKNNKDALVLVKILTSGKEWLTLEIFKQQGQSKKMWSKLTSRIVSEKREVILASALTVEETEDTIELKETPTAIINRLEQFI